LIDSQTYNDETLVNKTHSHSVLKGTLGKYTLSISYNYVVLQLCQN